MPVLTATERLGTVIDEKYAVEHVIAHGGMGVVFEATHTWTGRRVALKLIKPDLVEPARDARLLLEARTAAALSHPNVVQVLDMGATADGVSYLVMELLEGRTLKEELAAHGALPAEEALAIVLPLLGAIAIAHDRGIVHRDLKPANILLSRDSAGKRVPKLLDFGIAKAIGETGMTRSGAVLGTPHYLSPEQAEGGAEVGPAVDIWALGVTLYQCLSGRLPFPGERAAGVLQRVLNQPVPPLATSAPHVGVALAQAVERALHRDPRLRYDDARLFARALLVTARESNVALPDMPDPTGLPEWRTWMRDAALSAESTADDGRERATERPEQSAPAQMPAAAQRLHWAAGGLAIIAFGVLFAYLVVHRQPAPPRAARNAATIAEQHAAQRTVPASPAQFVAEPAKVVEGSGASDPEPARRSRSAAVLPKRTAPQHRVRRESAPPSPPNSVPTDKLMQSW